ncbi:putative metal-dependent hydrolase [Pyrobaculum oguniense TE7]|uniref:Metal-dependent hydrolase n=1 Tax=Pyrobaculum oguniense (strain DSM 13380 / JCM 10595 / TE7) TaxID=698757 RepID=H6Q8S2_PYROT|nr:putative metal-dependent hydrolase [Pyrobaculum oguniense TE7]
MYIDLTMVLRPGMPVFPGSPKPAVIQWTKYDVHSYYSNVLFLHEHTSTHVDAPAHFIPGAKTLDQLDVSKYFGNFIAVDFSHLPPRGVIRLREFENALPRGADLGPGWVVLIRTGYDQYAGTEKWMEYPELSPELAEHLAKLGINAVGIDSPSPDRAPFEIHKILLGREVLIYENLTNLDQLVGKIGKFYGLPLKVEGGSGGPVRAVAEI